MMKNILILLLLVCFSLAAAGQQIFPEKSLIKEGWKPVKEWDTSKVVMLITTENSVASSVNGYVVKQKFHYYPNDYEPGETDEWFIRMYLDENKKQVAKIYRIWFIQYVTN